MSNNNSREHGAVSLFVVVFAAMLITVVTVSFIRIMVREQQQATAIDLSQSAYDSAQAGVEDAKRALLRYQTICGDPDLISSECADAKQNFLESQVCNQALTGIVVDTNDEVKIQQTTGDAVLDLDQAYTCVKIALQTKDYIGTLNKNDTKIIPLRGTSSFDRVIISWFSPSNLKADTKTVNVPSLGSGTPLISDWVSTSEPNRPPIIRAQLMQFSDSGFVLSDFDGGYNASTIFLYPSSISKASSIVSPSTIRGTPSAPVPVHCDEDLSLGIYACSATILLPDPVGGTSASRVAYLNLSASYRATNYQIQLLSGSTVVQFDAVQPIVDSTGRANDMFRRVESRIETVSGTYPSSAVSLSGNLCKKFSVTDTVAGYTPSDCNP